MRYKFGSCDTSDQGEAISYALEHPAHVREFMAFIRNEVKNSFSAYKAAAICYYEDIRPEDREAAAIKNYKATDELTATGLRLRMSRNSYKSTLGWANRVLDAYQAAYKQRLKELAAANDALFSLYPGIDIRAALKADLQLPPTLWFEKLRK